MASPDYHEEQREVEKGGEKILVTVLVCDGCGVVRYCGDWPNCPHGDGRSFGEEPLEPYFDENITESGEYITTRGQRRAIMNREHLEFRKKRTDLLTGRRVHFDMGRRG